MHKLFDSRHLVCNAFNARVNGRRRGKWCNILDLVKADQPAVDQGLKLSNGSRFVFDWFLTNRDKCRIKLW
jgi:hypothetical protein